MKGGGISTRLLSNSGQFFRYACGKGTGAASATKFFRAHQKPIRAVRSPGESPKGVFAVKLCGVALWSQSNSAG